MGFPINSEVYSAIKHGIADSFYGTILAEEPDYTYGKLCKPVDQDDLTATYTAWGGAPEPRQLSTALNGSGTGGGRQAKQLMDYKVTGSVVEWEQIIEIPRSVVETQPGLAAEKAAELARKALLFMDRRFVGTILDAATLGYDGDALYSTTHTESGTAQDNADTSAAATGTKPTVAELEAQLDLNVALLRLFTDDALTPVNATVKQYLMLIPVEFEPLYNISLGTSNMAHPGLDVSGATGRFKGMFEIVSSPFVPATRHYIFCKRPGYYPVALLKNKDWEVVDNINTDSDAWRLNQTALIHSYARFEFIPWDWKGTIRQVWS